VFVLIYLALFVLIRYTIYIQNVPALLCAMIACAVWYAVYVVAIRGNRKRHIPLWVAAGAGLGVRLLFFGTDPVILSEDVYRYIWDGKVQYHGCNPFVHAPDDSRLSTLRHHSPVYHAMKYHECTTIYPAVAQLTFLAAYALGAEALWGLRVVYLLFELIMGVLLVRMFRRRDALILYALCPLVIIETYVGMHIDTIGMILCMAAWGLALKRRWFGALAVLALSVHVKYISLVCAPVLIMAAWQYYHEKNETAVNAGSLGRGMVRTAMPLTAWFFGIVALLFLPYASAGLRLFTQLGTYCTHWEFNSSFFSLAYAVFDYRARIIMPLITIAGVLVIALQRKIDLSGKMHLALFAFLLCTHTVYPWYVLWLVPGMVLKPKASELFFITAVIVSYEVLIGYSHSGIWQQRPYIRCIQYVPLTILLAIDILKGRFVYGDTHVHGLH
jgi:hypothetical protein